MQNKTQVRKEQCRILYNQSPILLIVTIFLMFLVLWYFWDRADQTLLVIWALFVATLTGSRAWLVLNFKRQSEINSPLLWLNIFALSAFISGMLWGTPLLYVLTPTFDSEVLMISFILTGMAAGSLVPLSTYLPCYCAFSIPTLLPFSLYFLILQQTDFLIVGSLVLIFLVSMIGFSFMVNHNVVDTIRLRFANVDLLEDLKIQKDIAEQANVDKSRFLAATSHDLRQPLHALDLYLGALKTQLMEKQNTELVNKASRSSQALSELLNALMDISRLDSGDIKINRKLCSLKQVIELVSNDFEQLAKENNISIKTQLEEVDVYSDPILLSRILRNLLSNAIKHNKDCLVSIVMSKYKDNVVVSIQDTGQGIAISELNNIFSEFYQLNNPERDRSKGLGLGLAIVKRLSTLLDIPVKVESEIGKGSEFLFTMPIEKKRRIESSLMLPFGSIEKTDLSGLFIIVIDDEAAVRDAIRTLLRAWNCEVLVASSSSELMLMLQQDDYPVPDLIISDYRLRDNKIGTDAVRLVRDHFKLLIPTIMITGDSSESIEAKVRAENCQLLLKPVNSELLREQIERLIV